MPNVTGAHESAQSLSRRLEDGPAEATVVPRAGSQELHLTNCLGPLQVCADRYGMSVFAQASVLTVST